MIFTYGTSGHRYGVLHQNYQDDFGNKHEEGYVGFGTVNTSPTTGMLAFKMGDTPSDAHMKANGNLTYNWNAKTSDLPGCTRYLEANYTPQLVVAGQDLPVTWSSSPCYRSLPGLSNIRIRMSTDGGATFPDNLILAASTPVADGTETVRIPAGTDTSKAVIKIESVGSNCHYFSDIVKTVVPICTPTVATPKWASLTITNFVLKEGTTTVFSNAENNATVNFEDFTSNQNLIINTKAGAVLNYTVNSTGNGATDIWIDQNHNGIFERTSERVQYNTNTGTGGVKTGQFTIPVLADGTYRLRLRVTPNYRDDPCYANEWGQVEDYTLQIGTGIGTETGTTESYSQIKNRWKSNQHINIESGSISSSTIQPGWHSAQWTVESVPGTSFVKFKNRRKSNQYIHIENGKLESSTIQTGWHSAQWTVEKVPGTSFVKFKNRWKSNQYIHIENGKLESSTIQPGWHSAQWTLEGNL